MDMDDFENRSKENETLTKNASSLYPASLTTPQTLSVLLAFQIIIFIAGVTLNVLNIIILVRGKKFGRRIKMQLLNVAVADILSAINVPGSSPVYSYSTLTNYPNSLALCQMHELIRYSAFIASLVFHGTIAIERFVGVYFPFLISRYKRPQIIAVILFGWLLSFGSTIDMMLASVLVPTETGFTCFVDFYLKSRVNVNVPSYFVKIFIPSIVIMVAYTMIWYRLRQKKIGIKKSSKERTKNREVLAMLAANGVLAVLIWTPYFIFLLALYASHMNIPNSDTIAMTLCGIVYINCFITPLVYLAFNHDYRKDAKQVLCKNRLISGDYEPTNSRDQSAPVDSVSAAMHIKHNCNPTNQK
ncbi:rhodopsin-like isoform X1 [Watersipora subatra]|uniref:rhodopsin-like isoform X1 n=1 Tax=Watersipora subatra TaxID=2589382 RepID=UPI00355BD1DF